MAQVSARLGAGGEGVGDRVPLAPQLGHVGAHHPGQHLLGHAGKRGDPRAGLGRGLAGRGVGERLNGRSQDDVGGRASPRRRRAAARRRGRRAPPSAPAPRPRRRGRPRRAAARPGRASPGWRRPGPPRPRGRRGTPRSPRGPRDPDRRIPCSGLDGTRLATITSARGGDRLPAMARTVYYAAASLDGYIADTEETLSWLLGFEGAGYAGGEAPTPMGEGGSYPEFFAGVGSLAMGSKTYEFIQRRGRLGLRRDAGLGLHAARARADRRRRGPLVRVRATSPSCTPRSSTRGAGRTSG